MLCLAGVGLLNGMLFVLFLSLIQANVSKDMLGRMMSFVMLASVGLVPLSLSCVLSPAATPGEIVIYRLKKGRGRNTSVCSSHVLSVHLEGLTPWALCRPRGIIIESLIGIVQRLIACRVRSLI